jgi:hypothetical protein
MTHPQRAFRTPIERCGYNLAEMESSTMDVALLAAEPGTNAPAPAVAAVGYIFWHFCGAHRVCQRVLLEVLGSTSLAAPFSR